MTSAIVSYIVLAVVTYFDDWGKGCKARTFGTIALVAGTILECKPILQPRYISSELCSHMHSYGLCEILHAFFSHASGGKDYIQLYTCDEGRCGRFRFAEINRKLDLIIASFGGEAELRRKIALNSACRTKHCRKSYRIKREEGCTCNSALGRCAQAERTTM